jgi:hypothetical protein
MEQPTRMVAESGRLLFQDNQNYKEKLIKIYSILKYNN